VAHPSAVHCKRDRYTMRISDAHSSGAIRSRSAATALATGSWSATSGGCKRGPISSPFASPARRPSGRSLVEKCDCAAGRASVIARVANRSSVGAARKLTPFRRAKSDPSDGVRGVVRGAAQARRDSDERWSVWSSGRGCRASMSSRGSRSSGVGAGDGALEEHDFAGRCAKPPPRYQRAPRAPWPPD
jgi:hypothetical protein